MKRTAFISGFGMSAAAAMAIDRMRLVRVYENEERLIPRDYEKERAEAAAAREARMAEYRKSRDEATAARRERDRPFIEAAEARRQRKAARRLALRA